MHSLVGLGRGAYFASRLFNPNDALISAPGASANDQLFNAGRNAFDYVKNGVAHPASVAGDIGNALYRLYLHNDPNATPIANTFAGEVGRNFNIGSNQGELGWDVGSALLGSGLAPRALRALDAAGDAAEAGGSAKFVAQGFSPATADYLAQPYEGRGHHFVPQRILNKLGVPPSIGDSRFNVLKPPGMSRGDFYELHFAVDPHFYAGRLPRDVGGGAWRGKSLDLPRYGPLSAILYGSPAPLKAAAGATAAAGAAANAFNGDR